VVVVVVVFIGIHAAAPVLMSCTGSHKPRICASPPTYVTQ
jgi:hypothetical protein